MRQQIELAAKLYRYQSIVKRFHGAKYNDEIEPYKQLLQGYMTDHHCDEVRAALEICSDTNISNHGFTVMMIMAAAVEICEPNSDKNVQ